MTESRLELLIQAHTALGPDDIEQLVRLETQLAGIAARNAADMFIDCLCQEPGEAVVVSGAYCENSLYEIDTVGFFIREKDEPAVFRTLLLGQPTRWVRGVTYIAQEDKQVL